MGEAHNIARETRKYECRSYEFSSHLKLFWHRAKFSSPRKNSQSSFRFERYLFAPLKNLRIKM